MKIIKYSVRSFHFILLILLSGSSMLIAAPADFSVQSPANGGTFTLSSARGKFVALHFLLKTECPFCLKHTRDYAKKGAAVSDLVQVFLKPDSEEEIKSWTLMANKAEIPAFSVFRDPNAALAEQFGIPGGYRFHNQTVHYPALVLLDPAGKEVFRYVGKSNSDRLPFEQFEARLKALRGKSTAQYNLKADRVALQGFDPVSYFNGGRALKGKEEFVAQHQGVNYRFASEANRESFQAAPEKYLPAYGGWCATAMAKGQKVEIDPANFKISNGRLFLFFKAFYANALNDWNKDEPNLTLKADANWNEMLSN
jgi:peroxiredoxin Q/BCP